MCNFSKDGEYCLQHNTEDCAVFRGSFAPTLQEPLVFTLRDWILLFVLAMLIIMASWFGPRL